MITHNGKQVSIAMRNRKAINLIARNGKAMFGELRDPGYFYGIDAAAKAVILAEYGKQVWSDVRDYAKAHPQIVEFINQDPHLAASISTNSNKERWLVGDGKAYIITNIVPLKSDVIKLRVKSTTDVSQSSTIFGRYPNIYLQNWRNMLSCNGTQSVSTKDGDIFDIELNNRYYLVNGNKYNCSRSDCTDVCGLFGFYYNGWTQYWIGAVESLVCQVAHLIPHLTADGQCGMLDLVTYTFHPNANTEGQFTIAITDKE